MFAETMAGIALVKSGVEFIKSNIQTAQDISQFASAIDNIFAGQEEINKKRNKQAGQSVSDQFGIKSVAQEVIDAKLAAEKIDEMRQLIDYRFGHGTWKSIVDERAKRIREAKEAEEAALRAKRQQQRQFEENLKQFAIVAFAVLTLVAAAGGTFYLIMR